MQSNDGAQLSRGVKVDQAWQYIWKTLAVMPAQRYDVPNGRFGCRFVQALAAELTRFRQCRWNTKRFIIFQTVNLQRTRQVKNSYVI